MLTKFSRIEFERIVSKFRKKKYCIVFTSSIEMAHEININSKENYCAFHKHANSEVQKPTNDCVFRCRQSS